MKGVVCPPVCPAFSRSSTVRQWSERQAEATSRAGEARWKRSTSTFWSRRATEACPAQAYSMVTPAASRLSWPSRLIVYER